LALLIDREYTAVLLVLKESEADQVKASVAPEAPKG
jgi:hypothetical protein